MGLTLISFEDVMKERTAKKFKPSKMNKDEYPKNLSKHLYSIIKEGVNTIGTYKPEEVIPYIEERLTIKELKVTENFLYWNHKDV